MFSRVKNGMTNAGSWAWATLSSGYESTQNGVYYMANTTVGQNIAQGANAAAITADAAFTVSAAKDYINDQGKVITNSAQIIKEITAETSNTLTHQDIPQILLHAKKFLSGNQVDDDITHHLPIIGNTLKIHARAVKRDLSKAQLLLSLSNAHLTINNAMPTLYKELEKIKMALGEILDETEYVAEELTPLATHLNIPKMRKLIKKAFKKISKYHRTLELFIENLEIKEIREKTTQLLDNMQHIEKSLINHFNQFLILIDAAKYGESAVKHYLDYAFYAKWAPHVGASIDLLRSPAEYLFAKAPRASFASITPNYFGQALGLASKLNLAGLCIDLVKSIQLAGTVALESKDNFPAIKEAIKVVLKKELKKELTLKLKNILKEYSSDWSADSQKWRLTVYQSLRQLLIGNKEKPSVFEIQLQHLITNLLIQTTSKLASKTVEPIIGSIAMPLVFLGSHSFVDYQTNLASDSSQASYPLAYAYKNTAQMIGFRDYTQQDSHYQLEFHLLAPFFWWLERQLYTHVVKKVGAHAVEKYTAYKMTENLAGMLHDNDLIKLFRKTTSDVLKTILLNQAEYAKAANPKHPAINHKAVASIKVMAVTSSIIFDLDEMKKTLIQQVKDKTQQYYGSEDIFLAPPKLSTTHRLFGKSVDTLVLAPMSFVARQSNRVLSQFGFFNAMAEHAQEIAENIEVQQYNL